MSIALENIDFNEYKCVGIYKTWERKPKKRPQYGIRGGKKHLNAYFVNKVYHFIRVRVSKLQAIWIKQKYGEWRIRFRFCKNCRIKFFIIIKKQDAKDFPDSKNYICDFCHE